MPLKSKHDVTDTSLQLAWVISFNTCCQHLLNLPLFSFPSPPPHLSPCPIFPPLLSFWLLYIVTHTQQNHLLPFLLPSPFLFPIHHFIPPLHFSSWDGYSPHSKCKCACNLLEIQSTIQEHFLKSFLCFSHDCSGHNPFGQFLFYSQCRL